MGGQLIPTFFVATEKSSFANTGSESKNIIKYWTFSILRKLWIIVRILIRIQNKSMDPDPGGHFITDHSELSSFQMFILISDTLESGEDLESVAGKHFAWVPTPTKNFLFETVDRK
jgi:hypothetical protein